MRRTMLAFATTLVLLCPASASASVYHWQGVRLQLNQQQAGVFRERMAQALPEFAQLVRRTGRLITVRAARGAHEPAGGNYTMSIFDGRGVRFEIVLRPENFRRSSRLGRHLQMHELAHAVLNRWASEVVFEDLMDAQQTSPQWRDCFPNSAAAFDPCVRPDEILADQFAFWATGDTRVRSSYNLPALLGRAQMTELVRAERLGS